ncbi:helix-turn-helix transcriptional regulator [Streptomyces sp. NPDC003642]
MFVEHSKEAPGTGTTPEGDVSAVAALDEPTRRRLYEHVVRRPGPVGRDEAAQALGLARQTAAFHLDRLAAEGLLEVVYERRSGRTGPGAGRPAKLYRRSDREVSVSLPERHYELAGRLLARAVEEADATGEPVRGVLHRKATELGGRLGAEESAGVTDLLERHGFEPRREGDTIVLGNCPFHALAREHTETVCGMNLHLLRGMLAALGDGGLGDGGLGDRGLGDRGLEAHLAPAPDRCCVLLRPAA